jgi:hypothetical protein
MKFETIEQGANVQHTARELNKLMAIIKATPEINTTQTRQELNALLMDLYIKLMDAGNLAKETRKYINK